MVAPYEADAQLAHLSRTGAVDAVITEDSDCLPYGCKKVRSFVTSVIVMSETNNGIHQCKKYRGHPLHLTCENGTAEMGADLGTCFSSSVREDLDNHPAVDSEGSTLIRPVLLHYPV